MDSQAFRLKTSPNFYAAAAQPSVNTAAVEAQSTRPAYALNARYPGYAARAEDGNVFTEYRPKCTRNVPVGQQFATRQWFQHNAENIIKMSRDRQGAAVGAEYENASTIPPSIAIVRCDTKECGYYPAESTTFGGPEFIPTGVERADKAPELFGTFEFKSRAAPPKPVDLTTKRYEGGRNTPRGSLGPIK